MAYILEGKTGKWEVVIGLEVHCQVKTKSKLFSNGSYYMHIYMNNTTKGKYHIEYNINV